MDLPNDLFNRNMFRSDVYGSCRCGENYFLVIQGVSTDIISYRDRQVEMNLVSKHPTVHPVPEKWVALGRVNLKMEFVGFWAKLGIIFVAFLDSLHRMGSNIFSGSYPCVQLTRRKYRGELIVHCLHDVIRTKQ